MKFGYQTAGRIGSWTILVNREDSHNKFWAFKRDDNDSSVIVRWGRIGTIGQSETFNYNIVRNRLNEKLNKGYRYADNSEITKFFNQEMLTLWQL